MSPIFFPGHPSLELWGGVGAVVVLVVFVCAFASGMVLFLRLRKRRIGQSNKYCSIITFVQLRVCDRYVCVVYCTEFLLQKKHLPTVTNPIYETGDDVYEELPDPDSDKTDKKLVSDITNTNVAPPLPATRYDHLPALGKIPTENGTNSTALTHTPKRDPKVLNISPSESAAALSTLSGEDCYTVMSPAGTLTMMPRNRHSLPGCGSGVSAPNVDGEFTLNCI